MWLRRVLSAIFLVLLICGAARTETIAAWNGTMYVSPDQVTVVWDAPDDSRVTSYEVQALWIDQDPAQVIDLGKTNSTNMIIQRPRTGHFKIRVRSLSDTKNMTSSWNVSSEVNGTANGSWRIYFTVPSVDKISVD